METSVLFQPYKGMIEEQLKLTSEDYNSTGNGEVHGLRLKSIQNTYQRYLSEKLTQVKMIELMKPTIANGNHYLKQGKVQARPAIPGETIITNTGDGKEKETEKTAGENEIVVRNPGGEEYIIAAEKFNKRYRPCDETASAGAPYQVYEASGECFGVVVDADVLQKLGLPAETQEFEFEPSWGGSMKCCFGDMIVSISRDVPEVYRIAAAEFSETYAPA